MGAATETISIQTSAREELVDVTHQVQEAVRRGGLRDGLVQVFSPHTTAGITIQENADPDVRSDLLDQLRALVPRRPDFRHREGNSDAHVKCSLVGSGQLIPLAAGKLLLGTWQAIYFCEFDGPRSRRLLVKILAG